jgi:hypothetical protein
MAKFASKILLSALVASVFSSASSAGIDPIRLGNPKSLRITTVQRNRGQHLRTHETQVLVSTITPAQPNPQPSPNLPLRGSTLPLADVPVAPLE